jgi:hypothetical protein
MTETVNALDELLARHACEQIMARGHRNIDEGRAADNITHYAPDARLEAGGHEVVGLDAIAAVFKHRQEQQGRVTLHAMSGFDFTMISADEAEAAGGLMRWLGTAETMEPLPLLQRFRVRFVRIDGHWLIKEMSAERISKAGV